MSGLACILKSRGFDVSGSDLSNSKTIEHLQIKNINVVLSQIAKNITDDIDLVIKSLAISDDNKELQEAIKKGKQIMTYPQALGQVMRFFENVISICGTHGKSTSTAMLANIFKKADLDPTVLIGTKLAEMQGQNYRIGKDKFFIVETCEYKEGFLNYYPNAILLTNIEADHLDYYKNEENYLKAFEKYIANLKSDGLLVVNGDDENIKKLLAHSYKLLEEKIKLITFGENGQNDYVLKGNDIYFQAKKIATLNLQVSGKHNRINALGAFALSQIFGIEKDVVLEALNHFVGTWRRLELKGNMQSGAIVYDDYAHHPTEIKATLQAMRELYPYQKIIAVFQPHQYSRTKFLLSEFAYSFAFADEVIIPNIYQVRDSADDLASVSPEDLVNLISKTNHRAVYGRDFNNTAEILKQNTQKGDVVLIMGAGDIEKLPALLF